MPRETRNVEDSTEYESQDNGLAEVAVRDITGVVRTVKFSLSERYDKDIYSQHPILSWLVAHAAREITRFSKLDLTD